MITILEDSSKIADFRFQWIYGLGIGRTVGLVGMRFSVFRGCTTICIIISRLGICPSVEATVNVHHGAIQRKIGCNAG